MKSCSSEISSFIPAICTVGTIGVIPATGTAATTFFPDVVIEGVVMVVAGDGETGLDTAEAGAVVTVDMFNFVNIFLRFRIFLKTLLNNKERRERDER
jgi:hypothetical protein